MEKYTAKYDEQKNEEFATCPTADTIRKSGEHMLIKNLETGEYE